VSVTAEQSTAQAGSTAGRKGRLAAESARYGVLRRLAPSLKHDMVVNLQAVAMMAAETGLSKKDLYNAWLEQA